jgi:Flp pilus assembly protein TadG
MSARFQTRAWRRLRGDQRGVAAIEFALVVPVVIVVYLVGFEVTEAATAYRKLTDTTVQLANVTAQFTSMACTDTDNVQGASSQIMTPYPTANLTIKLSEVTVNTSNAGSVVWGQGWQNGGPVAGLPAGTRVTMPAGYEADSSSTNSTSSSSSSSATSCPPPATGGSGVFSCYVMVQTTYSYQPTIGGAFIGPIAMQDTIFMLPRASASIPGPTTVCT